MKKWYQSKTIGGIIIALVGALLLSLGVDTGVQLPVNIDVAQAQQYIDQVKATRNNLPELAGVILSIFGSIVGILGRIKANTSIGAQPKAV